MLIESFLGNTNTKESLLAPLRAGRLSHALMIIADEGCGANYFATLLAGDIYNLSLKNQPNKTDNDPITVRDIDDGNMPKNTTVLLADTDSGKIISVKSARSVTKKLSGTVIDGVQRVILIKNREIMNKSASNALLKTIEEPKDDTVFILATEKPELIPLTIRSRCAVYRLQAVSDDLAAEYFKNTGVSDEVLQNLISVYGGRIGKISDCIKYEKRYGVLKDAQKVYSDLLKKDKYSVSVTCYKYVNPGKSKKEDTYNLDISDLLGDLVYILTKDLNDATVEALDTVEKYRKIFKLNVNINLAIENFATEICRRP
jgi:DNA polymerase III delta prime subunit